MADELTADVFRVVWQKWDEETRTEAAWLLTVARNLDILQLAYWDELGTAEIAAVLHCSESAAKVRLHRARAALRKADPHPDRIGRGGVTLRRIDLRGIDFRGSNFEENTPWAAALGVRFSYRVVDLRADGKGFEYQVGLVDQRSGEVKDSCLIYSFVAGAPQGTLSFAARAGQGPNAPSFASMAEAEAYLASPEYRALKEMILSLRGED